MDGLNGVVPWPGNGGGTGEGSGAGAEGTQGSKPGEGVSQDEFYQDLGKDGLLEYASDATDMPTYGNLAGGVTTVLTGSVTAGKGAIVVLAWRVRIQDTVNGNDGALTNPRFRP